MNFYSLSLIFITLSTVKSFIELDLNGIYLISVNLNFFSKGLPGLSVCLKHQRPDQECFTFQN